MLMNWPPNHIDSFGIYFKIGFSENPDDRRGKLQTGNPFELTLFNTYYVTNMKSAETNAHEVASPYKAVGGGNEWFHVSKRDDARKLIKEIEQNVKYQG